MNAQTNERLTILPCATCEHAPIRAFIELVSAVEAGAPAWVAADQCRFLARLGYKIELVCPADELIDGLTGDWAWHLAADGKVRSGLSLEHHKSWTQRPQAPEPTKGPK